MLIRVIAVFALSFLIFPAHALEDVPPAVPPPTVQAEALPLPPPKQVKKAPVVKKVIQKTEKPKLAPKSVVFTPPIKPVVMSKGKGFYVLELFSSQACTFCPKADAMMEAYASQPHMIALSCHIDYFDVKAGSLSLPVCSARQGAYELSLGGGPKYTPQMVVNGRVDAIGYLPKKIAEAFAVVRKSPISALPIERISGGLYRADLPALAADQYNVWLFVYQKPKTVSVKDGGNKGKSLTYYNVVSKAGFLGKWDGGARALKFDAKLNKESKGFALLVQRASDNDVVLAAKVE